MAPLASLLTLALSLSAVSFAAPPPSARSPASGRTHYGPSTIGSNWKHVGASAGSASVELTFVLNGDYAGLTERMETIAASRGSQSWLTQEELATYMTPSADAQAAVNGAISALGAQVVSKSVVGDKITVSTTVEKASQYFGAKFSEYSAKGESVHKTLEYTIPSSIAEHVSDVYPISTFGSYRSSAHVSDGEMLERAEIDELRNEKRATPSGCSTSSTTSACYRALYGYSSYQPVANGTNPEVGILAYIGQNYSPTDLATWISKYRTDAKGYSITVNVSNGAKNTASSPGVEAALDTQTVAGIIYPLPSTFYDIGTSSTAGDLFLITFQNFINMKTARPPVISISYGSDESDFTSAQATTMCNAAQQLSALGTTIVASSGDTGVDGQGDLSCPPFRPTYPGGCPYILSVGATQSFSPEVMVSTSLAGFYSGAGFSNYFTAPSYQSAQTAAYVTSLGTLAKGDYTTTGRAFPDVAAQGSQQPVVVSGRTESVGGTSASAPIVAGGLGLLNRLLQNAGKSTTGWIHPTLYAASGAFTDVTSGGAYSCGSSSTLGFPAKAGWDAASGLGTPLFAGLRTAYGV